MSLQLFLKCVCFDESSNFYPKGRENWANGDSGKKGGGGKVALYSSIFSFSFSSCSSSCVMRGRKEEDGKITDSWSVCPSYLRSSPHKNRCTNRPNPCFPSLENPTRLQLSSVVPFLSTGEGKFAIISRF